MSLSAFQRMSTGILAILGENSTLRTSVPCKVNVEIGVQVTDDESGLVYERDVATISNVHAPVVGDRLTHPRGEFVLDRKLQANGVNTRFILVKWVA